MYEGCGMTFIETATGNVLANQRKEERYRDEVFSCDPFVDFSRDEQTLVMRVLYAGMTSPGTQFSVQQGNTQWDILPKLISKKFDTSTTEVNPVDDVKVTSVTDSKVTFDIIKDTSYYTKGSYVFTLATNTLEKQ